MALTWMPLAAHSLASALVSWATAAFAGGVGGDADAALEAEQRGDVDDLAGALARAIMSRPASCESWKTLVRLTWRTCLPVVERDVHGVVAEDGAGVVDEDVDAAELVDDLAEEPLGAGGVGEVGLEGGGVAAGGLMASAVSVGGAAVAVGGDGGAGLRRGRWRWLRPGRWRSR